MPVTQTAGKISITVYTDGHPHSVAIERDDGPRSFRMSGASIDDLHDLRYCIDRVLRAVDDETRSRERLAEANARANSRYR